MSLCGDVDGDTPTTQIALHRPPPGPPPAPAAPAPPAPVSIEKATEYLFRTIPQAKSWKNGHELCPESIAIVRHQLCQVPCAVFRGPVVYAKRELMSVDDIVDRESGKLVQTARYASVAFREDNLCICVPTGGGVSASCLHATDSRCQFRWQRERRELSEVVARATVPPHLETAPPLDNDSFLSILGDTLAHAVHDLVGADAPPDVSQFVCVGTMNVEVHRFHCVPHDDLHRCPRSFFVLCEGGEPKCARGTYFYNHKRIAATVGFAMATGASLVMAPAAAVPWMAIAAIALWSKATANQH